MRSTIARALVVTVIGATWVAVPRPVAAQDARLQALLEEQRKAARAAQKKTGAIVSHVFHRDGKPIRDMIGAWRSA